jgi:hypothetical protein
MVLTANNGVYEPAAGNSSSAFRDGGAGNWLAAADKLLGSSGAAETGFT